MSRLDAGPSGSSGPSNVSSGSSSNAGPTSGPSTPAGGAGPGAPAGAPPGAPPGAGGPPRGPGAPGGFSRPPGSFGGRPDRRGPPVRQTDSRRINHQIRIRQIRVIDEDGKQLGVLETADALALALQKGLDLVEIAPDQRPPVCRIMDYGKFKYEEKKKQQASKRKQHQVQIKEVRLRPSIAEHDVQVKVKQARTFLAEGDKVVLCCLFRGRQMAHKDVGEQVIQHVFGLLSDIAKIEAGIRMEGKRMVMLLTRK